MLKTRRLWEERFHPSERGWGTFDVSLDADQKTLLVAAFEKGFHRLTLDPLNSAIITDRTQIKDKSGHKGSVLKVEWHPSGRRFATAGADKLVIIWKDDFSPERQVKFAQVPQTLAWNPKLLHLIAAAGPEFIALNIPRDPLFYRAQSNIWSAAWDHTGDLYALGMENGAVSVRDRRDNELCLINRADSPVWCLAWAPIDSARSNLLYVADWSGSAGFYESNGKQRGVDCVLAFLPIAVVFGRNGQVVYLSGADKKVHALSLDGVEVATVGEFRAWPQKFLPVQERASRSQFVTATADGVITMLETTASRCSHLHGNVYVARESLVNLSVRNLDRNREISITNQDAVSHVAAYRNLIAAASPTEVVVMRQVVEESLMKYEEQVRVPITSEFKSMLIASRTVLLIQDASIQSLTFTGAVTQTWTFSAPIQTTKIIGGAPGEESFLVALHNGAIVKVLMGKPFRHPLATSPSVPVTVDINRTLQKLAVVCENSVLYVYDVQSGGQLLFQEAGADGCAWNLHHADLLAFSLRGLMKIKLGAHKVHTRRMETPLDGNVIGYAGSRLFYETPEAGLTVVDVPHAMLIHQSVEAREFDVAYEIACFGASDNDWTMLGARALENLSLGVAKNCYRRLRDGPTIQLVEELEQRTLVGDGNADVYLGEIFAFRGKFDEAARFYNAGSRPDLAVKMFVELRQFAQAEQWATSDEQRAQLLQLRAEWAVRADDKPAAVDIFLQLGQFGKAMEIMRDLGWKTRIRDVAVKMDVFTQKDDISMAAKLLMQMDDADAAVELLEKIKDIEQVVQLKLRKLDWSYLLELADREPFYREMILIPYARHLVEHDRFPEARESFCTAGHPEMATDLLHELARVALNIHKFADAGFYQFLLGQNADDAGDDARAQQCLRLAELYQAYSVVESAVEDPFLAHPPETVFNAARILAASLWTLREIPVGIKLSYVCYTLAVWGTGLRAHKTARQALERLKTMRVPKRLLEKFTEVFVQNRVQPFSDPPELADFCHSCSSLAPVLNVNSGSYACANCQQPFVYCHASFEQLPLVEFTLSADVSGAEACALLARDASAVNGSGDNVAVYDASLLQGRSADGFFAEWKGKGAIVANRKVLLALREHEVVVHKHPKPQAWRFYRNMLADVAQIATCESCWQMFNHDDWFAKILETSACPFCRAPAKLLSDDE